MVKRIKKLWDSLDWFTQTAFEVQCFFALSIVIFIMGVFIGGCVGEPSPETSTAKAIPAAVQSHEVPVADTSTIPDMLILRPGQSAVLVEDMIAKAYIPAEGNRLYEGDVRFEKGTVLIKPVED